MAQGQGHRVPAFNERLDLVVVTHGRCCLASCEELDLMMAHYFPWERSDTSIQGLFLLESIKGWIVGRAVLAADLIRTMLAATMMG